MRMNQTLKIVLVTALFLGAAAFATSYYVEEREAEIVDKIITEVNEQEQRLRNIAEITDRNGADEVVEAIIRDCSIENRARFDSLLDRLGTLGPQELNETQDLFDACARFYASRKAVMVSRLEREYEVYRDMVDMLRIVDDSITVERYQVNDWERLVSLEQKRSDIYEEQVNIQQKIITALIAGETVSSENIQALLARAQNINEEAMVVNQQIDTLRSQLVDP